MKSMLDRIKENLIDYPVLKQYEFYQPLKNFIYEAWVDASDENDKFLNNNEGDKIEI